MLLNLLIIFVATWKFLWKNLDKNLRIFYNCEKMNKIATGERYR